MPLIVNDELNNVLIGNVQVTEDGRFVMYIPQARE